MIIRLGKRKKNYEHFLGNNQVSQKWNFNLKIRFLSLKLEFIFQNLERLSDLISLFRFYEKKAAVLKAAFYHSPPFFYTDGRVEPSNSLMIILKVF